MIWVNQNNDINNEIIYIRINICQSWTINSASHQIQTYITYWIKYAEPTIFRCFTFVFGWTRSSTVFHRSGAYRSSCLRKQKACRIFGKNIDTTWSRKDNWLVVEPTHLKKYARQNWINHFPQGVKINNIWNYHLEYPRIVVSEQRFYYLSHEWKPWSAVNLVYLLHEYFVK